MLTAIVEIIAQYLKYKRASTEIALVCRIFGLTPEKTNIWRELNSMYNPVAPFEGGVLTFAECYYIADMEERCWGYIQFMIAVGDVTESEILKLLCKFSVLERLSHCIGMERLNFMIKTNPKYWWKDETSCSCVAS